MLTGREVLLLGALLLFLFLLRRIRRVNQDWKALGSIPTDSVLVAPLDILSSVLPRIPRISYGAEWSWRNAYERQPRPKVRFLYRLTVHV